MAEEEKDNHVGEEKEATQTESAENEEIQQTPLTLESILYNSRSE